MLVNVALNVRLIVVINVPAHAVQNAVVPAQVYVLVEAYPMQWICLR